MNKSLQLTLVFATGLALAGIVASIFSARRDTLEQEQRLAWEREQAALKGALAQAKGKPSSAPTAAVTTAKEHGGSVDPQALLTRLAKLTVDPALSRTFRPVLALLEQLTQSRAAALTPISQFLTTGQDVIYSSANGRPPRDMKALADSLMPYSLRFGLFDVLRQLGGDGAEQALVQALTASGSGLEIAFLTQMIEEMAPGKHRELALGAANKLLATAAAGDRDYLLGVLKRFGDTSYVGTAQAQLVQADGLVDRSALRYLQQTLGPQTVALASQTYQDPRVTAPESKESLARVALNFVGSSAPALELFHKAVLDQGLLPDQKRNLIEDLNEDGIANRKALTPADLELVANRYAITQEYLRQDYVLNDKTLNAAFREADKDLLKMLEKAAAAGAAPPAK